jgi:uncharacterized OB-fold protein
MTATSAERARPGDGLPDPRPRLEGDQVAGVRCTACGYPAAVPRPRCPVCAADVAAASFGPEGVVWSSTVVNIPLPGREGAYGLAYVDLDDGPRILAHTEAEGGRLEIGTRVRILSGPTESGDIAVVAA